MSKIMNLLVNSEWGHWCQCGICCRSGSMSVMSVYWVWQTLAGN